ncbi:BZ3500_MvSof-1268-A1-R1_Chr6-2g08617 [Microbotryum saponariae]|uniref:BZ3500_MvSof-1268-A1-R1_Chr6-2g08617 protein n=1 Tax=Microbotryum saponariae TaxID=289078 RepID=A0A2X0KKN7_9BASI|nr:BZ3500_MvSof-1268-A1-R1_Chr6-2g08617 [Microbotryum saponariae]SDA07889.1 BZ3501_MvSof-1269-A2-R1_Chr6-1g08326 [Microbotryum saponariae]
MSAEQSTSSSVATFKRYVEVGRVVLLSEGPQAGKLATIVEIIDHNRVRTASLYAFQPTRKDTFTHTFPPLPQALIEGPLTGVPRQSFPYRRLVLTPFVLKKLPRAAGTATVKKVFEASGVLAKWEASAWAQKRKAVEARRNTTDFDRFEIMLLKKQRRRLVQVAASKAKKSA